MLCSYKYTTNNIVTYRSDLSQLGEGGNVVLKKHATNTNVIQGRMPSNLESLFK
jgi:hypothetical protein